MDTVATRTRRNQCLRRSPQSQLLRCRLVPPQFHLLNLFWLFTSQLHRNCVLARVLIALPKTDASTEKPYTGRYCQRPPLIRGNQGTVPTKLVAHSNLNLITKPTIHYQPRCPLPRRVASPDCYCLTLAHPSSGTWALHALDRIGRKPKYLTYIKQTVRPSFF